MESIEWLNTFNYRCMFGQWQQQSINWNIGINWSKLSMIIIHHNPHSSILNCVARQVASIVSERSKISSLRWPNFSMFNVSRSYEADWDHRWPSAVGSTMTEKTSQTPVARSWYLGMFTYPPIWERGYFRPIRVWYPYANVATCWNLHKSTIHMEYNGI